MNDNWKDVTSSFSEEQRCYDNKYLVVDNVLDDIVEASYFENQIIGEPDEIYVGFGLLFGIIYVSKEEGQKLYEEVINILEKEYYENDGEPSEQFMKTFCKNYKVHHHTPDTFLHMDEDNEEKFYDSLDELMDYFLD